MIPFIWHSQKIGKNFGYFSCQYFFLKYLFRQGKQKKKNKQMGLHQTKKFLHSKEIINKMKRQPTKWKDIFTYDTSDKGLISKIYKMAVFLQLPINCNYFKK